LTWQARGSKVRRGNGSRYSVWPAAGQLGELLVRDL